MNEIYELDSCQRSIYGGRRRWSRPSKERNMAYKTHIFSAPESAFLVNSFLLEGADEVVVIDAQFLASSARGLRAQLDATGKRLAALILTHPHPDHYNGAAILLERWNDVPVLATASTNEGIRATAEAKRAFWTPSYGQDYPQAFVFPNGIISSGEVLRFGDITLAVDDLGPGEASDNVIFHSPQTDELFASDLIYSSCHPWLAEERSDLWQAQLDAVEKRYAGTSVVHAGHGPSGDLTLFDAQRGYISAFEALVRAQLRSGALTDQNKANIRSAVTRRYPGYPLEFLIDLNAEAVATALSLSIVT
jgi:glyoxylase-like metal-dependent hydrolase (beta-lactamase superfamily II)